MTKLLILDQDLSSREALRAIFAPNYILEFADNLVHAEELLHGNPALFIIGLNPPAKEEMVFLASLADTQPILILSVAPLSFGKNDAIVKPFNVSDIRAKVTELTTMNPPTSANGLSSLEEPIVLEEAISSFERGLIVQALEKCDGIQTHAAKLLGTTRRILRYRMDKLGIAPAVTKHS